MKRMIVLAAALAMTATLAPQPSHATTKQVFMSANFKFCVDAPGCTANQDITIPQFDTVEWVFADPACLALHAIGCTHTATKTSGPTSGNDINSGNMPGSSPTAGAPNPKMTYSVRFTRAGTYNYICAVHTQQGMAARVIVTPGLPTTG